MKASVIFACFQLVTELSVFCTGVLNRFSGSYQIVFQLCSGFYELTNLPVLLTQGEVQSGQGGRKVL